MKTGEVVNLFRGIQLFGNLDMAVDPKFTYAININRGRLLPIVQAFETAQNQLIEEHAMRDDKGEKLAAAGGGHPVKDMLKYVEALNALGDEPVEVSLHKVPLERFPDKLPINVMTLLEAIIIPPKEEGDAEVQQ